MNYDQEYKKYKKLYLQNKMNGGSNIKIKELYLIRHGQTDYNKKHMAQGYEIDSVLNETGRREASRTGEYLKKYRIKDKQFDCIYASPLKRTKETATIIKNIIGYDKEIIYKEELVEKKEGKKSGTVWNDPIREKYRELLNERNPKDPIEQVILQNTIRNAIDLELEIGNESDELLKERAMKVLTQIIESPCQKIIIVSHWNLLFAIIQQVFRLSHTIMGDFKNGSNCFISYLHYDMENNTFNMITPPNTLHLMKDFE